MAPTSVTAAEATKVLEAELRITLPPRCAETRLAALRNPGNESRQERHGRQSECLVKLLARMESKEG